MYLYYDSYFFRARHISSPRSTKALRSSGDLSSRWKLSSPCKDCFLQRQAFARAMSVKSDHQTKTKLSDLS